MEGVNSNKSCSFGLSIENNSNTSNGNENSTCDTEGILVWIFFFFQPNEKLLEIDITGAFGTNPNIMNGLEKSFIVRM